MKRISKHLAASCAAFLIMAAAPGVWAAEVPGHKEGATGFGVELDKSVDSPCAGRKLSYQSHSDAVYATYDGDGQLIIASVDGQQVRDADDLCFRLAPDADDDGEEVSRFVIPDDPAYKFLGEPGDILWQAPQSVDPWSGWRPLWSGVGAFDPHHEHEVPTDLVGDKVHFELTNFDGPGWTQLFFYNRSSDEPWVLLSSKDKREFDYDVGGHGHFTWAFSRAGVYSMTFVATAEREDGTKLSSPETTIYWLVGTDKQVGLPEGTTTELNEITKPLGPFEETDSSDPADTDADTTEEDSPSGSPEAITPPETTTPKATTEAQPPKEKPHGDKPSKKEPSKEKLGKRVPAPQPAPTPSPTQEAPSDGAPTDNAEESVVITEGHMDLMAYANAAEGMVAGLRDGADPANERWRESGTFSFAVPDTAIQKVPDSVREFIPGTLPDAVWELPQAQKRGLPWLGFSTEIDANSGIDTDAPIQVSLAQVSGPGRMLASESTLSAVKVRLDSEDQSTHINFESHAHSHMAFWFTNPGEYQVTFRFTARDKSGNEVSRDVETAFHVGGKENSQMAAPAPEQPKGSPLSHNRPESRKGPKANGGAARKQGGYRQSTARKQEQSAPRAQRAGSAAPQGQRSSSAGAAANRSGSTAGGYSGGKQEKSAGQVKKNTAGKDSGKKATKTATKGSAKGKDAGRAAVSKKASKNSGAAAESYVAEDEMRPTGWRSGMISGLGIATSVAGLALLGFAVRKHLRAQSADPAGGSDSE